MSVFFGTFGAVEVTGIDLDTEKVSGFKSLLKYVDLEDGLVKVELGDALNIGFSDETFDVIIANDVLYFGAVQALSERGLRIPQDFSIVAITSRRMAEMTTPTLTSAEMPVAEMGRIGTELLIRQLEETAHEPTQLILPAELTVRQSSGPRPTRAATRIGDGASKVLASG